jgi:hypothetical protein
MWLGVDLDALPGMACVEFILDRTVEQIPKIKKEVGIDCVAPTSLRAQSSRRSAHTGNFPRGQSTFASQKNGPAALTFSADTSSALY